MPDRVQWTALPRSVDVDLKKIRIEVFVSPRLENADEPRPPWREWPDAVRSMATGFRFAFDGSTELPAVLDTTPLVGDAMWRCFLSKAHACKGGTSSPTIAAANEKRLIVTSNRAGVAGEEVDSQKQKMFATLATKFTDFKQSMTMDAHRAIVIERAAAHDTLSFLNFWRDRPRDESQAGPMELNDFQAFKLWLQAIRETAHLAPLYEVVERYLHRLAANPFAELSTETLRVFAYVMRQRFPDLPGFELGDPPNLAAVPYLESVIFHRRAGAAATEAAPAMMTAAADHACPTFDFHQRVAGLAHRPPIMRALGLILDFTMTYETSPLRPGQAAGTVRVVPPSSFSHIADTPETQYDFVDGHFSTHTTSEIVDGFLGVGTKSPYCLQSIDGDVASLQLVHSMGQGAQSPAGLAYETEAVPPNEPYDVPADRTMGIALMHCTRDKDVADKINAVAAMSTASNPVLTSDQLTSGYIIEVQSTLTGNQWYSLCARTEEYLYGVLGESRECLRYFNAGPQQAVVRLVPTKPLDQTEAQRLKKAPLPDELNITDAVFRWDGWSLAAPKHYGSGAIPASGQSAAVDDRPLPWTLVALYKPRVPAKTTRSVHGEEKEQFDPVLVPLRYGAGYKFRVKAADLAGVPYRDCDRCDEKVAIGDGENRDQPFVYRRYEPVPHPVVLLVSELDREKYPGETLRRLVVHVGSRFDRIVERVLIPPPATFRVAEQHGMFDDLNPDQSTGFDDVRLLPQTDGNHTPSWRLPEASNTGDPIYAPPPGTALGKFWPDPMAHSLCVRIEDLVTREVIELKPRSFYERRDWPRANRLVLRLKARRDGSARIRSEWCGSTTLCIELPPAWVARVTISSGLPEKCIHHMAHPAKWDANVDKIIAEHKSRMEFDAAAKLEVERTVVHHGVICGCHPMISPCEVIDLAHPVRRPTRKPVIDNVEMLREKDQNPITIGFDVKVDRKSTGHLDIEAAWTEIVDDPSKRRWSEEDAHAHVFDKFVKSPEEARDYDPYRLPVERIGFGDAEVNAEGKVPTGLQQFPDTKHRLVRYRAVATSRFRSDFPSDTPLEKLTRQSKEREVDIPSSARPAPPVIAYVMPTFGWTRKNENFDLDPGGRFHSHRRGGGLRVFLERPWFSSGAGELLGVVLWPSMSETQCHALNAGDQASFSPTLKFAKAEEPLARYITRWGADPIYDAPATIPFLPTPNHFHSPHEPIHFACGLALEECEKLAGCGRTAMHVSVAGYTPTFDEARGLWYCDIVVRPIPSYYTFIRLALVRYQPSSLRDREISRVVRAEFAQLVADRTVSVTRVVDAKRTLSVQVFGTPPADRRRRNVFTLHVERQCGTFENSQLSWVPDPNIKPVTAPGAADALWSWQVKFPEPCDRYRLVVREFEELHVDARDDTGRTIRQAAEKAPRLIYADVLEV